MEILAYSCPKNLAARSPKSFPDDDETHPCPWQGWDKAFLGVCEGTPRATHQPVDGVGGTASSQVHTPVPCPILFHVLAWGSSRKQWSSVFLDP